MELLRYRSNLLGADLRTTNFGGGNTSSKFELPDPFTRKPVRVLAVKGSGIGRETALRLAERGAQVMIADRDEPAAAESAAQAGRLGSKEAAPSCWLDLVDHASIAAALKETILRFGALDGVINEDEPTEQLRSKLADSYACQTLTKRSVTPRDCAEAICWLAGDRAEKTAGHLVPVDGALTEAFL